MSGLVNANYAAVSGIENMPIKITNVTQRLYKGYKRDELLLQKVRQEFISHKIQMFNTIENLSWSIQSSNSSRGNDNLRLSLLLRANCLKS